MALQSLLGYKYLSYQYFYIHSTIYIKDLCSSLGGGGGIQPDGWITERPTLLCGPGERLPQTDEPQDWGLHSRKGKAKNTLKICVKTKQYGIGRWYKLPGYIISFLNSSK